MSEEMILTKLNRLEAMLAVLVERQTVKKEWYTIEEFALLVKRCEFTCREWCRLGRVHGEKRRSGRGAHTSWVVSHVEFQRFQREGLLPVRRPV